MEDILLANATLEQIQDRLSKLDEITVSSATTDDLICGFDFHSMNEDEKIRLIFKILNPFEKCLEITYVEEEKTKKIIKSL